MVKCQCRNCGEILDFEDCREREVINDFGHFKFIKNCAKCEGE